MINVTCACGRKLRIGDEYAGQNGQCPVCSYTFLIPGGLTEVSILDSADQDFPSPRPRIDQILEPEIAPELPRSLEAEPPLVNHAGEALGANVDFFAPAPIEIGVLKSAESTLLVGKLPKSLAFRISVGTILAVLVSGVAWFILGKLIKNPAIRSIVSLSLGSIGMILGILATRFRHTCTYIGKDGISQSTCNGKRDNQSLPSFLLFKDVTDLLSESKEHRDKGRYTHTSYSFTWKNAAGMQCYQIQGSHNSENGEPPGNHYYHFGRSSEIAWTLYLLEQWNDKINNGEPLRFRINAQDWISLGDTSLTTCQGGKESNWDYVDIRDCLLKGGKIRIRRKDAQEGWLTTVGVFKESINRIPNAQLFFHLLGWRAGIVPIKTK